MSYNYKGITNNTVERSRILYPFCWWDDLFTDEELNEMCNTFSKDELCRGFTADSDSANTDILISQNPETAIRKSKVKFHHRNDDNGWIFDKLNWSIEQINSKYYNFDLNGYDFFQYTEYDDYEMGKYDFHMDTIMEKLKDEYYEDRFEIRKLSITLLLNDPKKDYDGGNFEINHGQENNPIRIESKRGRLIFFPSFMIHRVTPVTRGKRKSLVVWVLGPKFR